MKRVLQQSLLEINKSRVILENKKQILTDLLRAGDSVSDISRTVQKIADSLQA